MIIFIKHIDIEGPETLGSFFAQRGFEIRTIDLHRGEKLPDLDRDIKAVVSLGGPMNVYEEEKYPFLKDEDTFLKDVLAKNIPFLGICLGAQLLAKASGGIVVPSPEKEIGWFDIDLTDEGKKDPLLSGFPDPMEVFQWHGDMCLPSPYSVLLASSSRCPIQAFKIKERAYGLQFHAEITDKSIRDWSQGFQEQLQPSGEDMLKHYEQIRMDFLKRGEILCGNFLRIMGDQ